MKTRPSTLWPACAVLTAAILLGCMENRDIAKADKGATNVPAAVAETLDSPATTSTNLTLVAEPRPPKIDVPAELTGLVEMAQAGVGEEALLAYIDKHEMPKELDTEVILYLNDIGVSTPVLAALITRTGTKPPSEIQALLNPTDATASGTPEAETMAQPAPPVQAQAAVAAAAPVPAPTTAPSAPPAEAIAPPQQQVTYNYFYDTLAPYGTWYNHPTYGNCWQPSVAVVSAGWRPYCDRGRWVYTDCGWYWSSYYSWGWAPFHYGGWFSHGNSWFWAPGYTWAPSWVSWRSSDLYCGWAPLPPGCGYRAGIGFTYYGSSIAVGFGFGLGCEAYTFVGWNNFHHRSVRDHCMPHDRSITAYNKSTVVNNYINGNNNTIINEGVGRDRVARLSRSEVRKVALHDVTPTPGAVVKPDRLERGGSRLAVYRPQVPTTQRAAAGREVASVTPPKPRSWDQVRTPTTLSPSTRPNPTAQSSARPAAGLTDSSPTRTAPRSAFGPARTSVAPEGSAPARTVESGRPSTSTAPPAASGSRAGAPASSVQRVPAKPAPAQPQLGNPARPAPGVSPNRTVTSPSSPSIQPRQEITKPVAPPQPPTAAPRSVYQQSTVTPGLAPAPRPAPTVTPQTRAPAYAPPSAAPSAPRPAPGFSPPSAAPASPRSSFNYSAPPPAASRPSYSAPAAPSAPPRSAPSMSPSMSRSGPASPPPSSSPASRPQPR